MFALGERSKSLHFSKVLSPLLFASGAGSLGIQVITTGRLVMHKYLSSMLTYS